MDSLSWIYGTWQVNMNVTIPSIFPKVAKQYNDSYILNVCIWNDTTFFLKLITDKHGVLPWIGPYITSTPISSITPVNGVITIPKKSIIQPDLTNYSWPITNITSNDLISYPIVINTNNTNKDKNGISIIFSIDSISWSQIFYGVKGCQGTKEDNPYSDCYPIKNPITNTDYDFSLLSLPKNIPAVCPIKGSPPTCNLGISNTVMIFIYIFVGLFISFIITIIILSIFLIRKK